MSRRELIVLSKKQAAQGRGLMAAKSKAAAKGGAFERILRGTVDGGGREFHRVVAPDEQLEALGLACAIMTHRNRLAARAR